MARDGVNWEVLKLHSVVLVQAEAEVWVPDLPGGEKVVVGETLGYVVQVPLERLASAELLPDCLPLCHVPVVPDAFGQGLVEVTKSAEGRGDLSRCV